MAAPLFKDAMGAQLTRLKLFLLFLALFGAKLWTVHQYGSPLPYIDQWNQEAAGLFKPLVTTGYPWDHLLRPTAEHHILFYGMLSLSLFKLNQQWDQWLHLAANAAILSLLAVALVAMILRVFEGQWASAVIVVGGVLFGLPVTWNSTVIVMDVQYLFQILFAVLGLRFVLLSPALSGKWFFGWAMAICSLYTSGAGLLGAAAIFFAQAVEAVAERRVTKNTLLTCLGAGLVMGGGFLLLHSASQRAEAKASSAKAFALALLKNMSWPCAEQYWLAPLFFLPLILLFLLVLRRRQQPEPAERLLIGLGAYVVLNMAAIAYARGGDGSAPAPRYLDLHVVGGFVNIACLFQLIRRASFEGSRGWLLRGASATWLALVMTAFGLAGAHAFSYELPHLGRKQAEALKNARAYLLTGDRKYIYDCAPSERAFEMPKVLQGYLDDPVIRGVLPPELRPPLKVVATPGSDQTSAFHLGAVPPQSLRSDLERYWGSWNQETKGPFESEPLKVQKPYLQMEVAGYKTKLKLVGKNGRSARVIIPDSPDPYAWRTIMARVPDTSFALQAEEPGEGRWFAFAEPRELSQRNYQIRQVLENAGVIFLCGALPLGFLLLMEALGGRCSKSTI